MAASDELGRHLQDAKLLQNKKPTRAARAKNTARITDNLKLAELRKDLRIQEAPAPRTVQLEQPQRLDANASLNTAEKFEYEHDPKALKNPLLSQVQIDPSIYPFAGSEYPSGGRDMFGVFGDSCPDRWGRLTEAGPFLDDQNNGAAPPFVAIADIERASRALELDPDNTALDGRDWLRMLVAGASQIRKTSAISKESGEYVHLTPITWS
ncbi:hypothetical protein [Halopseudomonas pelagia]|uniref:hypothetical protein n=1 Tax=Halopseudomonas pelagia TaxID=553151 RepID=UPI0003B783C2|nr:hypothetical protein [Halopseudomonas pelagia]